MARRSQAERSAGTQAALLRATIGCLADRGFDGTSTTEICRRAGVSRGAQLHHFPTKESLLIAALEHLCDQRHAEFRGLVEGQSSRSMRLDAAFDQLWKIASSDTLVAWIELTVASRTNPVLADHMRRVSLRLEDEAEATLHTLFGIPEGVRARAAVRMVLSLLDGLAFRAMLQDEAAAHEALAVFRALVEPFLGDGG